MNTVEVIKGIDAVIEGLEAIKAALNEGAEKKTAGKAMNPPATAKTAGRAANKKEKTAAAEEQTYTLKELNGMKYNEFKKLAASLGVDCNGKRDEILNRVIALGVVEDAQNEEAPAAAKKTPSNTKSGGNKLGGGKKVGAKKDSAPAKDEFDEQAEEVAEETPVEDILEALKEAGVKATKKNYVSQLAYALREGLISLDEEGGEDAGEEEGVEDIDATSYFEEYDPNGYNTPDNMTKERANGVEALVGDILDSLADESLTEEDVDNYLEENCTDDEIGLLGDEYDMTEKVKLYIEMNKRLVDNDGELHTDEGDPYEIGDEINMCCGHALKYIRKSKKFVCERCGEEYEAG